MPNRLDGTGLTKIPEAAAIVFLQLPEFSLRPQAAGIPLASRRVDSWSRRVVRRGWSSRHSASSGRRRIAPGQWRVRHRERPSLLRLRRDAWRCSCVRSEEHTSELQSLRHLVCRLLLEKKKKL